MVVVGSVVRPTVRVDAVIQQQPRPRHEPAVGRPLQVEQEVVVDGCGPGPEPGRPRAGVAVAEAELEEQLQVRVVRPERPVVDGLGVVRVGAGLEEQPGEGQPIGVSGLVVLAAAQHAGQGCEGVGAVPQ